jgi:hypothetical protein
MAALPVSPGGTKEHGRALIVAAQDSERDSGLFIFGYCFEWRVGYQAGIYAVLRRP